MWSAIISGVSTIFNGWIDVKKKKQEAEAAYHMAVVKGEQDWDIEAMKAARYSWKDELITIIWYSPLIVGWYDRDNKSLQTAEEWIEFVSLLPYWWQFGAFGIMAASFGLRWYFKQQNFVVAGNKK